MFSRPRVLSHVSLATRCTHPVSLTDEFLRVLHANVVVVLFDFVRHLDLLHFCIIRMFATHHDLCKGAARSIVSVGRQALVSSRGGTSRMGGSGAKKRLAITCVVSDQVHFCPTVYASQLLPRCPLHQDIPDRRCS